MANTTHRFNCGDVVNFLSLRGVTLTGVVESCYYYDEEYVVNVNGFGMFLNGADMDLVK